MRGNGRRSQAGFSLLEMSIGLVVAGALVALIAAAGNMTRQAQLGTRTAQDVAIIATTIRRTYATEGYGGLTVSNLMARAGSTLQTLYVPPAAPAVVGTLRAGNRDVVLGVERIVRTSTNTLNSQLGEGFSVRVQKTTQAECLELLKANWDEAAYAKVFYGAVNMYGAPGDPTLTASTMADWCSYGANNGAGAPDVMIYYN